MIELPQDVAVKMAEFGRFELNPRKYPTRSIPIADYYNLAQEDPAGFVAGLADAVLPVGGWAAYGAMRLLREVFDQTNTAADADRIRDAALEFLRHNGVPARYLSVAEWTYWLDRHDGREYWLTSLPPPERRSTAISPLSRGEVRRVARLNANRTSNVVYVRIGSDGFVAEIEAPRDYDEPERTRRSWHEADALYDLYLRIGNELQIPPHWCDAELMRFFPLPRPKLDIY